MAQARKASDSLFD